MLLGLVEATVWLGLLAAVCIGQAMAAPEATRKAAAAAKAMMRMPGLPLAYGSFMNMTGPTDVASGIEFTTLLPQAPRHGKGVAVRRAR